jgi:hypothetical protein
MILAQFADAYSPTMAKHMAVNEKGFTVLFEVPESKIE